MLEILALAETEADALRLSADHAPYLKRLMAMNPAAFAQIEELGSQAVVDATLAKIASHADPEALSVALREAKQVVHLAIAGGDLSRRWILNEVTGAITRLADVAAEAALGSALSKRGLSPRGIFTIALGKMGAGELNYSSDIDLAIFYDPETFDGGKRSPGDAAARVAKDMVRILDERTADGYVFRTDLRLRPDPGSTPLAVSTQMADLYYESVGQNWERMVWIKARACAGDLEAAGQFIEAMGPFVWRRHLDYWAIADVHAIKRMINVSKDTAAVSEPDADVKLAPGGIREIEFFTQTQQIILGGRNESVRTQGTCMTLAALAEIEAIGEDVATELVDAYHQLRHIEHRIQMRTDEQSHTLPTDKDTRRHVAALSGISDLEDFDAGVRQIRERVHGRYLELFAEEERMSSNGGNLVFTGVDDDPGTVKTLREMGFSDPANLIETVRRWHRGGTAATRTTRGRELLTALLPDLLRTIGQTGDADRCFLRFRTFFEALTSGVQTLSMLIAEDALMVELVSTLAIAPRLAETLGKRPELLESLIDADVIQDDASDSDDFETAMDRARRFHRDEEFLIGHRLLHGRLKASEGAAAWTELAEKAVRNMAAAAEKETVRRFGDVPGRWSVIAMGRLGGCDMTAGSDLDIMILYDPFDGAEDPQTWFTRFTKRLITALSAPTGEGLLYEVDMRLRPSGGSGPVAVRLSAFEVYHRGDAWTWERMALTRVRPVAGDVELGEEILQSSQQIIVTAASRPEITRDVADMRARLLAQKPGTGLWDMKVDAGGLVDVEFIAQNGLLLSGDAGLITPNTVEALDRLYQSGYLEPGDRDQLVEAWEYYSALLQVLRLAHGSGFDPEMATEALKNRLCRAVGANQFDVIEAKLQKLKAGVEAIRNRKLQMAPTES